MGTPAERTPQQRNATRLLAHEMWNAVDEDRECEEPGQLAVFGLACEVRDLEIERNIAESEVARLTTRVAELHQTMVKISNDTPYSDEAKDALAQRGALLAEVGTLKARVAELENYGAMLENQVDGLNAEKAELVEQIEGVRGDLAECQSILDHMDTVAV